MLDINLIKRVIMSGAKGKKKRLDVRKVIENPDKYASKIYDLLERDAYVPTKPKSLIIQDKSSGKMRRIGVVPFYPDGIIHRLCVETMQDILMKGMYHWSCASIPGRGNRHAMKGIKKALRNWRKSKYCAKMDIYHYYPSINPDKSLTKLSRKIKDRRFIRLVERIIKSDPEPGLTIGFYINQWLANFYLESLDHYICTLPGIHGYVRNMDDLILIGPNKKKLHKAVDAVDTYLSGMGLRLKENWQVFKTDSRGIDFVGYRFFHGYTKLRKRNFLKLTSHCRKVMRQIKAGKRISFHSAAGLLSRKGQLEHCNSENILKKYYYPIGDNRLKSIVSNHSRKQKEGDMHGPYGTHKRIS